jgi:hypothetical protein
MQMGLKLPNNNYVEERWMMMMERRKRNLRWENRERGKEEERKGT